MSFNGAKYYSNARLNSASDLSENEFYQIYGECKDYVSQNAPWECYLDNPTDDEKKAFIRGVYEKAFTRANHFNFISRVDDRLVQLALGTVPASGKGQFYFVLYGKEESGTKAWLHDTAFHDSCFAFLKNNGVTSIAAYTKEGTSLASYVAGDGLGTRSDFKQQEGGHMEMGANSTQQLNSVIATL